MLKYRALLTGFLITHLLLAQVAAFAWGNEGHHYINSVAAKRIPHDMPGFFRSAGDRLTYLAVEPDRWREKVEPTLKNWQEPDHFLNMERLEGMGELPVRPYEFIQKLYEKQATIADPKERSEYLPENIGMQPYAAIAMYERLKVAFREYRNLKKEHKSTKPAETEAVYAAGILGHYVGDAAQPLHASIQYNGWVGDNPNGFTTRKTIHYEFESAFVAKNVKGSEFEKLVKGPAAISDPFADYVAYLHQSNGLVTQLYTLDKDHAFENQGTAAGKEFVLRRLAAGSQKLVDLWYTAWLESAKDVPPYVPPKPVSGQSPTS
ncbi:MAG TPA: nuclease [Terriglobales bacterium]